MTRPSRAFDAQRRSSIFQPVPNGETAEEKSPPPYERTSPGRPPTMRLRFCFRDGRSSSYAYSDLREVHHHDAGHITLHFLAMRPITITIKGRNLNELAVLIENAAVKRIEESDDRDVDRLESEPAITSVAVASFLPEPL